MGQDNRLLRVLGLGFGLAAVIGAVVGQGILRAPGVVADATGSPEVIIGLWIAGALIAMVSALPYAELGAAIPRAGGQFAFIHRALGDRMALAAAFATMFLQVTTIAMLGFVTGEFLVRLGVGGGRLGPVEMGLVVTVLFALLNASGTRSSGASQIAFSTLKGLVLVGLIVALFAGEAVEPVETTPIVRSGLLAMGTAILVINNTYNGWWEVVYYGEEMRDPGRQVPRALFGGIISVAVIYVLLNLAMLHVLTPDQMAGSNLVAADAAGMVFGERGDYFLTLFGVLSVGAITNLQIMSAARAHYAMARARILPEYFAKVDKRGTPLRAMALATAIGASFILTGTYQALSSMTVSIGQGLIVLVMLSVIALRRKEPDLHRPFRMPLYPASIVFALAMASSLLIVFIVQDPLYSLSGFIVVAVLWVLFRHVLKRRVVLAAIDDVEGGA
ncbi:Amino acid permease [Altererythrobacter epoxidivorans]|uniref:Amino acid permease n=1 Tax=Altererythrobacter epoxidivorans TaxID=361183 RepID=A0A0M4LW37_9SPHN|nr:APC family permease [Altererythrobacter epoxidivorans]ALE17171.1 Amino acid permease [Altererythrobacter epoxidivorans]